MVERTVRRLNEVNRWASPRREVWLSNLATASRLTGLDGIRQGRGLDIRPYVSPSREDGDNAFDVGLVVFKNYVEQASNGRIGVEMFIGTQLCSNGAECLQGVADGNIDVYISTSGGASGIFPFVQVLDLPYLMSDDRVAEAVLQNGVLTVRMPKSPKVLPKQIEIKRG